MAGSETVATWILFVGGGGGATKRRGTAAARALPAAANKRRAPTDGACKQTSNLIRQLNRIHATPPFEKTTTLLPLLWRAGRATQAARAAAASARAAQQHQHQAAAAMATTTAPAPKLPVRSPVPADIEIAQSIEPKHISLIAEAGLGLQPEEYELQGRTKAKVRELEEAGGRRRSPWGGRAEPPPSSFCFSSRLRRASHPSPRPSPRKHEKYMHTDRPGRARPPQGLAQRQIWCVFFFR